MLKKTIKRFILHYINVMDNCITVSISMYYIHYVSVIVISNASFVSFFLSLIILFLLENLLQ